jgi:hypothetical protein
MSSAIYCAGARAVVLNLDKWCAPMSCSFCFALKAGWMMLRRRQHRDMSLPGVFAPPLFGCCSFVWPVAYTPCHLLQPFCLNKCCKRVTQFLLFCIAAPPSYHVSFIYTKSTSAV